MANNDEQVKPRLTPEGRFALWGILCESVSFGVLLFFTSAEIAIAISLSLMLLLTAMRATWNLHRKPAYWISSVTALVINSELAVHLPLTNRAYRGLMLPFGILEFVIAWIVMKALCWIADRILTPTIPSN